MPTGRRTHCAARRAGPTRGRQGEGLPIDCRRRGRRGLHHRPGWGRQCNGSPGLGNGRRRCVGVPWHIGCRCGCERAPCIRSERLCFRIRGLHRAFPAPGLHHQRLPHSRCRTCGARRGLRGAHRPRPGRAPRCRRHHIGAVFRRRTHTEPTGRHCHSQRDDATQHQSRELRPRIRRGVAVLTTRLSGAHPLARRRD